MNSSARPAGSDEKPEGGPVKPLLIREGTVPKVGEFPFPWTQDALRDNLLKEALEMRVGGLRAKSEESFSHHHHMLPFWRLCAEETGVPRLGTLGIQTPALPLLPQLVGSSLAVLSVFP